MSALRSWLARHALLAGALAAFVPIAVLLVLQYRWLATIERTSAAAHRAGLGRFVETVAAEVEERYGSLAERALAVPASVFHPGRLERAAAHFRKAPPGAGVRVFFLVHFGGDEGDTLLYFDPAAGAMVEPEASDTTRAITLASSHWRLLSSLAVPFESGGPVVDERDAAHRLVLYPVTDLTSRVVGVAGMLLDEEAFATTLLPGIVEAALASSFPEAVRPTLAVTVRDGAGKVRLGAGGGEAPIRQDALALPLRFVFRDWRVSIGSRDLTPEQWARSQFAINMAVAVALALVLAAGILLALKTAARELQLSHMKADFVSNVSHELRTPLASIRMFGELLRTGRVTSPEKVREYGELIEAEGRRLTQLVDNILDFARIESGRKEYRFVEGDLGLVVTKVLRAVEVPLQRQGFEIERNLPAAPLPPVRLDPEAFAQVVQNLLDNAVKYSGPARRIALGIEHGRGAVSLWVQDEGIGIPREEQERIFQRFHRVGTGLVHDVRGSGLGLAIVRHVVEAHGGSVVVESEPGKGSRFTVHLPALRGQAPADAVAAAPEMTPG